MTRSMTRSPRAAAGAVAMTRQLRALLGATVLAACTPVTGPAAPETNGTAHEMATMTSTASPILSSESSPSVDPLAACEDVEAEGEPVEISVGTVSYSFDPPVIEGPRHCQPFVIVFTNSDPPIAGSPAGSNKHNIIIRFENLIGPLLFDGEIIGEVTIRYEVPGLPAGEHYMYCEVHPSMTGTVIVAP